MTPKKALCIHDMSTVGRCSLAVITPVISALGIQAVALPTAVLSTHFGGFGRVEMKDLTDFCRGTLEHYKRIGLKFDCVYSGFLSSARQMDLVKQAFGMAQNGIKLCDPVMADHGRLYSSITDDLIHGFRQLCAHSDIITPNPTEALILLGRDYGRDVFRPRQACEMARRLGRMYCDVIITGTKLDDGRVVCVVYDKKQDEVSFIPLHYTPVSYPGTGDLFGACLAGYMLSGYSLPQACEKAARFIEKCVEATYKDGTDTKYGVHLEPMLKYL